MEIDSQVKKESLYVLCWCCGLCAVMLAVYALLGMLSGSVIGGALVGTFAAAANFFLMGLTIQRCISLEQEQIKKKVRRSQGLRLIFQLAAVVLSVKVLGFDLFASVIPLLFPRIAVMFRPAFKGLDAPVPVREEGSGDSKDTEGNDSDNEE